MAKQQSKKDSESKKKLGNIRLNPAAARAGLNLDSSISQVGPGRLTYALNAAVENFDSSSVNYQNEPGNELCLDFPTGYKLIGSHFIPEKRKNIFFLVNPSTGDSEIGFMDNNNCQYQSLVNAPCLNFNIKNPIPKIVHRITNCTTELYWTDGINPRRYLDIENIPYKIELVSDSLCNAVETEVLDCNQLKIQPNFRIPQLMITQVRNIGNLTAGTYQFAAQYSDAVGNELTSYYSVTNPLPISDEFKTTVNFDYQVGKSIVVGVSNLDLSGQFEYYNLAVIKTINNISSVELVGTYSIEESSREITYTGGDETAIRLSMIDIFEKFPYYDIAQDVTAVQDVLVWDNLTSIDRINYQSIASQITLNWETHRIPADENYADEINAVDLRGYMRDEVYAFEVVFLLKNGKQTDGFHIPGREIGGSENFPDVPDTNNDFIGEPDYFTGTTGYKPYWKIYNTGSLTGISEGYSSEPNYKGPWEYGEFSYWESTEEYPCEEDVWGDLAGQPIRHHKFPDVLISPIIENGEIVYDNNKIVPAMQNDAIFPIGVRVDNTQINSLIQGSDLTQDQKDDIVSYKIVRADRGTNKSVIAKGILRNVNKYTRDEQDYFYPNYPYNDLGTDPYVLANNNAWSADSEAWLIYLPSEENDLSSLSSILDNVQVEVNGTSGVFEYTSALNGKVTQAEIQLDEVVEICSLTRPVPLLGKMIIGPGNYDVWRCYTDNKLTSCGHEIEWKDPFTDWNDTPYVSEVSRTRFMNDDGFANIQGSEKVTVITKVGGIVNNIYCGRVWTPIGWIDCCRPRKELMEEQVFDPGEVEDPPGVKIGYDYEGNQQSTGSWRNRRTLSRRSSLGCKEEKPQPSIEEQEEISYRQVFNSPETSFGQPFLGGVLKLESVMFGAGKAHWVQVKDNANYKLLSKEAQQDALDSSRTMAQLSTPQSLGVMFTAYQAYLTIYVNGITRKNYAMSYNSRANYDYSYNIDNNTGGGIKQRDIDLTRYLIPGVQSLGTDEDPINNWNRETSVFIKTIESREYDENTLVDPILFPSKTPSLLNGADSIIEDKSRYTIGSKGACATPGQEKDIEVVSYYASMKNIFPNQYGQMYSYTTVDTGYQPLIEKQGTSTMFGGDTFISRFAFKTKLPFFIDNRVGAPDDSDIFYDEIGNIGYPRYWHSSRSILEDYDLTLNDSTTPVRNLISYKAHNFDCPNDPSSVPVGGGAYRTFYDGYMYLFAYGIPNFYCESTYNTDLRQAFNNKEGDFWPHISSGIPDDWVQETNVPIAQDNTYYYNVTFSKQNKENVFTHLPPDWEDDLCYTVYPFRAIYSDAAATSADSRVNNWLVYRALSLHDFPQNYGNLTSLDGIQNKAILARFENKSLLYNNLLTIDTSNPQAAYIGNPRLFDSSPPIDFAETDLGYVGSQNKFLLKIPQGQVTVDAKRGQVFLVQGAKVLDLTAFGSGVNRFMADNLPFEILQHFPNVPTDNHFNGIGLHGVYDSKFERIIITKLDYTPLSDDIKYDEETGEFYIEGTVAPLFRQADPNANLKSTCIAHVSDQFSGTLEVQYVPCDDDVTLNFTFECGSPMCSGVAIPCSQAIVSTNVRLFPVAPCGATTTTTTTNATTTTSTTFPIKPTTTTTTTLQITTTTTTLEEVPSDPPRTIIYLEDEEYFCNRSWTISFDFNTRSWISFHSYLPNFYIGENNFYYSGINGCCTSFDVPNLKAVAGRLLPPELITTTTTTARGPLFPPQTTTTTTLNIEIFGGEFIKTFCDLDGTGVITVPPTITTPCYTPSKNAINPGFFLEGYQVVGGTPTITTSSLEDACVGMNLISPNILPITIKVSYENFVIGEPVYVWNSLVPYCESLSEGWYSNFELTNSVFYVGSNSKIQKIENCDYCLTTTTTTLPQPVLDECCGFISVTPEGLYVSTSDGNNNIYDSTQVNGYIDVPGFVYSATTGVAFTSTKLWTIDTDIKEWDITLSPFTATFSRDITYGETPSVAGNIALSDTVLLGVDSVIAPQKILEIDVTTNTAVPYAPFEIQPNRVIESNLLYTTENKLVLISKDGLDYYITQFDYSTGNVELDVSLGQLSGRVMLMECQCIIKVLIDSTLYIFDPVNGLVDITSNGFPSQGVVNFKTLSQSSTYINCGIENTTTTTTSTSTTTTTTTLSPNCNEYEITGPVAIYYTDCFGQQQTISVGSGQTTTVCASVGIIGSTLIGPCGTNP